MNPNIKDSLIKIAEDRDMTEVSIDNPAPNKKGQGYLSDTNVITIQAKNEILRQSSAVSEIFEREIYMYEYIFPAFYNFEKERGITNPFPSVPKCYQVFKDIKPEILIMENLNESGYQSWNGKFKMQHDHVKIVLSEYGRFHAISFAIQDQNPKLFKQLSGNLDNVLVTFLKRSGYFNTFVSKAKRVLTLLDPEDDVRIYERYRGFLCDIEEKFEFAITTCDNHHAILHADCWSNNMLFKYEDSDKTKPVGIRLIDFQLSKLGSPVLDIVYFFYVSTTKEVLKDFKKYQHIYYNSFSEHLKALGSNADSLYPFSIFIEHWKKYAIYGLILSSLVNYSLLCDENEVNDFTEIVENGGKISEAFDMDIADIDEYKKKMKIVIEHFVENNFI